jgi:hypothetical protein
LEEKKIIFQKDLQQKIEINRTRIKLEIKKNKRTFYIFESRDEIEKKINFTKESLTKNNN